LSAISQQKKRIQKDIHTPASILKENPLLLTKDARGWVDVILLSRHGTRLQPE